MTHPQQKQFSSQKTPGTSKPHVEKSLIDETKEIAEESLETVKKVVNTSVSTVKEKFLQGEEIFAEEIEEGKKMVKDGAKVVTSESKKAWDWFTKNRHIVLGVIILAFGFRELWEFIRGVALVVIGILFITGYFREFITKGFDKLSTPKHAKKMDTQEISSKK